MRAVKREFSQTNSTSFHHCHGNETKPIEIYVFVDPLCPECWSLEPVIKKLHAEYGRYISIKHVLSGSLATLNLGKKQKSDNHAQIVEKTTNRTGMSCDGSLWIENPVSSPYLAFIAIKAAELQGRKAGIKFLRKLQEVLFLENQNVSSFDVLKECAGKIGLDVNEFVSDIHSESAAKAFQCDLKITSEMEVREIPSLVFFNQTIEDEGIKITGCYPYEIFVQILEEMLPEKPERAVPPPIDSLIKHYKLLASSEIALIYNMKIHEVEKEMKKLQLKQMVEKIPVKYGVFWRYIGE